MPAPVSVDRPRCLVCRQAIEGCWCRHVSQHEAGARVILLQHPREARNPLGTARMAHLSLPGSELLVGVDFEDDPRFRGLMAAAGTSSVVLSAAPEARPIAELAERTGPLTLWVVDGTWWQARKIWQRNPSLQRLPAYRIQPAQPSRYLIRSEPAPHCLSTVEAVADALDAISGAPGRHQDLLAPLTALVDRQQAHARSADRRPRRRSHSRPRPGPQLPAALAAHPERALLICAEGNAWPGGRATRAPVELLQWLAVRPATGQRFSALLQPAAGLSPMVKAHLELDQAWFTSALTQRAFLDSWRDFVSPDDIWCSWGYRPAMMLGALGLPPPPPVDVRAWCHEWMRARPSQVEDAHALIPGVVPVAGLAPADADPIVPQAPGRGGHRLAMLEAVFRHLLALAANASA